MRCRWRAVPRRCGSAPHRRSRRCRPPGRTRGGFDAWLEAELARRRDERKAAALKSLVDRPLPKLTLTTVDGRPYDTAGLRGKVLLLNFFASW